jgi:hypothetical protein
MQRDCNLLGKVWVRPKQAFQVSDVTHRRMYEGEDKQQIAISFDVRVEH